MFRVAARATRTASHGEGIGTRKWCPAVSVRVDSLVSALQVGTRWKEQMRGILAFLAVLLVIGFVAEYWRMLLALCFIGVAVACAIAWMPTVTRAAARKWAAFQQHRRQQREQVRMEQARLAARADEEHELYLRGDARGIYGQFPPADLDEL